MRTGVNTWNQCFPSQALFHSHIKDSSYSKYLNATLYFCTRLAHEFDDLHSEIWKYLNNDDITVLKYVILAQHKVYLFSRLLLLTFGLCQRCKSTFIIPSNLSSTLCKVTLQLAVDIDKGSLTDNEIMFSCQALKKNHTMLLTVNYCY